MSLSSQSLNFATDRIKCHLLQIEDIDAYCALYTNEKVMRKISSPLSQEKALEQFHRAQGFNQKYLNSEAARCLTWSILNADNQFIGTQGLVWHQPDAEEAEIGIMLNQQASGKGYPVEAMGALTDFGLIQLRLKTIFAHFDPQNLAVERFVKKLGYDVQKDPVQHNGQYMKYCQINYPMWQHSKNRVHAQSDNLLVKQEVVNGN